MWSLRQDPLQLNAVTSIASILTSSIKSPLTEAPQTWPHLANLQATDLFLEGPSQYKMSFKALVEKTFCHDRPKSICGRLSEQARGSRDRGGLEENLMCSLIAVSVSKSYLTSFYRN